MNNNITLAILARKKIITSEEAAIIAKELENSVQPHEYKLTVSLIDSIFSKIASDKAKRKE